MPTPEQRRQTAADIRRQREAGNMAGVIQESDVHKRVVFGWAYAAMGPVA